LDACEAIATLRNPTLFYERRSTVQAPSPQRRKSLTMRKLFRGKLAMSYVDILRAHRGLHACAITLLVAVTTGGVHAQAPQAAPVPAAVAIPRPTVAEVAIARDSFAKFLDSTDAATRAVLAKYPGLLEVRPPGPNTAIVPALAPPFQAKHEANLEVAKRGDAEILFMGDSITDFWRNSDGPFAGKPVLDKHFGQWNVANFGIAGDTTQGVLYRLQNGEGQGFSPKAVMLMIGTNNTARNSAAEIGEGIGAVVLELQRDFPQAKILLLGVFPRSRPNDPVRATIAEINRTIAKLHDGERVHYLDIGAKFLDADGAIPTDVMSDLLHPSAKGYEIWAQAVKEPLSKLMGDTR
jgi:lysophospholipase L1-like esterase